MVIKISVYTSLLVFFLVQNVSAQIAPPDPNDHPIVINAGIPTIGQATTQLVDPNDVDIEITYDDKGGFGLFEGDIYIDTNLPSSQPIPASGAGGVVIDGYRWPNNTLYYKFHNVSPTVITNVRIAVSDIEAQTNLNIVELS